MRAHGLTPVCGSRSRGFRRPASKFTRMRQTTRLPPWTSSDAHQEPRRASRRPPRGGGASPWDPRARRGGARLAAGPQCVRRRDRDQRQDHDDRVDRPYPPGGGNRSSRRRQRRHGRDLAGRRGRSRRHRRLRGLLLPTRGHRGVRPRGGGAAQPSPRPSGPLPLVRGLCRGEAADLRQSGARRCRGASRGAADRDRRCRATDPIRRRATARARRRCAGAARR